MASLIHGHAEALLQSLADQAVGFEISFDTTRGLWSYSLSERDPKSPEAEPWDRTAIMVVGLTGLDDLLAHLEANAFARFERFTAPGAGASAA
jgi:hypothetical protein